MKSLKATGHQFSDPLIQLEVLNNLPENGHSLPRFKDKLEEIGLFPLQPTKLEILQINLGYMCNLTCSHCHVDAGPDRKEIMNRETMQQCMDALDGSDILTVDLSGGAPEMNPDFRWFVEKLSKRNKQIIVRSNLTILVANKKYRKLPAFFKKHKIQVVASLPCYTVERTDIQRGEGVFDDSIEALKILNELGYGVEGTGLELHLVYNPVGPHLPPPQEKLKADYDRELGEHFGIVFNNLYNITNMPIGRYLDHLIQTGQYEKYMTKLVESFNPGAAFGVMCRNTLSVGWDGTLYDCDFNQMLDLKVNSSSPEHISAFSEEILATREIIINQHCYGCTAGAGSTCQGSIA